jgi:putative membrane protein
LPADRTTKLHKLAALPRSDAFDNGYIRVVGIEDRRKTIAMFERARTRVKDRDLRAWIDRSLTVMRVHLTQAQAVASSLAG